MLRRLAVNTLITGTSFLVTGLVPLLLIPLFLDQYGVAEYGLLVLARLLLPTAVLAVFDFGLSELASFAVAKGRHADSWDIASRYLSGLLLIAAIAGLAAALMLNVFAPLIVSLFHAPPGAQSGFRHLILATSIAFPILLLSLLAEGVLKGFEDFKRLRALEVLSTLLYAGAAVLAVAWRLSFEWIGFVYLAYGVVKAVLICSLAVAMLSRRRAIFGLPDRAEWRDLRLRSVPLGFNRMIGVGQGHAAPVLIGAILGSAAVGFYDLVVRIPRFLKIVTGVLNSAVLPIVMRLDEAGDKAGVQRLFQMGLLGVLCIVTPLVAWGMSFSEAMLRLWVSERYSVLWSWQALMFAWPLVNAITSFTCGGLLGRHRFVSALNWIVLGQIVVQIGTSMLLLPYIREQSFVVGQILAVCGSLPLQLWLVSRECDLHLVDFKRHFACIVLFAVVVAACLALDVSAFVHAGAQLILSLAIWCGASGLVIWAVLMNHAERQAVRAIVRRRLGRPA
ncbi:MAG: oligosaccharide flippase family protein [Caldimonas sp.]